MPFGQGARFAGAALLADGRIGAHALDFVRASQNAPQPDEG
jgi:hypothetical protein